MRFFKERVRYFPRCVTSSNGPPSELTCPLLLLKRLFRTFSVLPCSLLCVKCVAVSEQLSVVLLLKETHSVTSVRCTKYQQY